LRKYERSMKAAAQAKARQQAGTPSTQLDDSTQPEQLPSSKHEDMERASQSGSSKNARESPSALMDQSDGDSSEIDSIESVLEDDSSESSDASDSDEDGNDSADTSDSSDNEMDMGAMLAKAAGMDLADEDSSTPPSTASGEGIQTPTKVSKSLLVARRLSVGRAMRKARSVMQDCSTSARLEQCSNFVSSVLSKLRSIADVQV